jgi:hypothetical protein
MQSHRIQSNNSFALSQTSQRINKKQVSPPKEEKPHSSEMALTARSNASLVKKFMSESQQQQSEAALMCRQIMLTNET